MLTLVAELESQGWTVLHSRLVLKPGVEDKRFDMRKLSSKRLCYQAILAREDLWAKGLSTLPSTATQGAYHYVLVAKGLAGLDWNMENMAEFVKALLDQEITSLALQRQAVVLARPAPVPRPPRALAIAGDSGDESEPAPAIAFAAAPLCEAGDSSSTSSSSSSSSSSSGDSSSSEEAPAAIGIAADDEEPPWEPPKTILGRKVGVEAHQGRRGLRVPCGHHPGCKRFRTLGLWSAEHGPRSECWYLATWLSKGATVSAAEHKEPKVPTKADVSAFMAANSDFA